MTDYIVSARKYRPTTFHSVIGQKTLTQTLKRAIDSHKLAHAYLFCGPRGVGKTTCARIFAKTINCLSLTPEGEACNECESCKAFNEQRSYNITEMDAASNNSVEDIRQLTDMVRIPPQIGHYKVFIIDEVHMLSTQAFNAFLKTLEEPPHYAIFILATTEKHKVLPTILSRCQIFDFHRITVPDTIDHLKYVAAQEGIETDEQALQVIAQKADGGMRDALSIFDQMVSSTAGKVTYDAVIEHLNVLDYDYYFQLTDYFLTGAVSQSLLLLNDILQRGFDGQFFITGLSSHFRDLLVSKDPVTLPLLEVSAIVAHKYGKQAALCSNAFLYKALEICNECDLNYKQSKNKRLLVELTLIRLCQLVVQNGASSGTEAPVIQKITPDPAAPTTHAVSGTATAPVPHTSTATNSTQVTIAPPPSATAAQEPPKSRLATGKIPSISIRANQAQAASETAKQTTAEIQNNAFDEQMLLSAWKSFSKTVEKEPLFYNTLLSCSPQLQTQTQFEVVVNNLEQRSRFEGQEGMSLLSYLRKELKNSHISMSVREMKKEETQKAYGQRDQFQAMAKENPHLMEFRDRFGLELA